MSLEVIFLGTAGSIPTAQRSMPAIVIRRKGELILFDFGEGAQRNFLRAHLGLNRKTRIFVTHLHGDHIFGIPGLIQTMSLMGRKKKVEIYGLPGIKDFVDAIFRTVRLNLTFPVEVFEVEEGLAYKGKEYEVHAAWTDHVVPNLAYALIEKERPGKFYPEKARALGVPEGPLWRKLQYGSSVRLRSGKIVKPTDVCGPPRPGRKIAYSGDTRMSENMKKLAEDCDLLIHDATFDDRLADKAEETGHSTASQAATVAKESNAKKLVLTHISARYGKPTILLKQAQKIFKNTIVAEDLLRIPVKYEES